MRNISLFRVIAILQVQNSQKERATNGKIITAKVFDSGSKLNETNGGKYE
jgi:hypothetical protein